MCTAALLGGTPDLPDPPPPAPPPPQKGATKARSSIKIQKRKADQARKGTSSLRIGLKTTNIPR